MTKTLLKLFKIKQQYTRYCDNKFSLTTLSPSVDLVVENEYLNIIKTGFDKFLMLRTRINLTEKTTLYLP